MAEIFPKDPDGVTIEGTKNTFRVTCNALWIIPKPPHPRLTSVIVSDIGALKEAVDLALTENFAKKTISSPQDLFMKNLRIFSDNVRNKKMSKHNFFENVVKKLNELGY